MKIIEVENLGKKYIISHQREKYTALRDVMINSAKSAAKAIVGKKPPLPKREEFWAIKDISFSVNEGDRIGIIGRNGAGKSTLLKLLSRITEPTAGKIKIKGKIASLLEVGTGFHPELTGRENIFLNGAILGMSKKEIQNKFNEIVEFAEIEKFLDTPVKRYSSGMYVRLAFAVAAFLDPDTLVVDEVLAVGDSEFQKKCIYKMNSISKVEGRTLIFVSHNMEAIRNLCNVCIHLENGRIMQIGENVNDIISYYLKNEYDDGLNYYWSNDRNLYENPWFKPIKLELTDDDNNKIVRKFSNNICFYIQIEFIVKIKDSALKVGIVVYDKENRIMFISEFTDSQTRLWPKINIGKNILRCKINNRFLNEGIYRVELISSLHYREWINKIGGNNPVIFFEISGGLSDSPYWIKKREGFMAPVLEWSNLV